MSRDDKSNCDKEKVASFDYSALSPEFARLSKPAQRALLTNGIKTPADLSRWDLDDVMQLHGIGPSSRPMLLAVLRKLESKSGE